MDKEKLKIEIETLKQVRDDIQSKIDLLEKELCKDEKVEIVSCDSEQGYHDFLTITKKLNEHTAQNYFAHLRGIKNRLEKYDDFVIEGEIYNITDIDTLMNIKEHMLSCKKVIDDNKTQHNAFTAAFNNYLNYILNFHGKKEPKINSDFVLDE